MAGIMGEGCWAGVEANELDADEDDVSVYKLLIQIFIRSKTTVDDPLLLVLPPPPPPTFIVEEATFPDVPETAEDGILDSILGFVGNCEAIVDSEAM